MISVGTLTIAYFYCELAFSARFQCVVRTYHLNTYFILPILIDYAAMHFNAELRRTQ